MNLAKTEKAEEIKFTKEQILSAEKYKHSKDVVNVVLENDRSYTLQEVEDLIKNFYER